MSSREPERRHHSSSRSSRRTEEDRNYKSKHRNDDDYSKRHKHREEALIPPHRIKEEPMSDIDESSRTSRSRPHSSYREDGRSIKQERRSRSRSRSPRRHNQRSSNRDSSRSPRRRERHHRDRQNSSPPRNHDQNRRNNESRTRDWNNFFNPSSEMSQLAEVKREQREAERQSRLNENNPVDSSSGPPAPKEEPNFGLSGKLTEDTNMFRGVVIKYSEPPEARKPQKIRWRLYPFKGDEALPVMYIHRQSAYLLGRERKIADIPVDHPSCSKQHAVLQYRLMPYEKPDGTKGRRIKPYIIDLESANGTYVNGDKIEPKRYVELFEKDVLKFGYSSREYVLLHEHSKESIQDDTPGSSPEGND